MQKYIRLAYYYYFVEQIENLAIVFIFVDEKKQLVMQFGFETNKKTRHWFKLHLKRNGKMATFTLVHTFD